MEQGGGQGTKHVTILLSGGRIDHRTMQAINEIAARHGLTYYLTTIQNLRLLGIGEENYDAVRQELAALGLTLKSPGRFPVPRVCVGAPWCNLALADTARLSDALLASFGGRTGLKPKYKIAVSACPANCGGALLADIGIVATRKGFDLYAGGKGGALPRVGRKIASALDQDGIIEAVGRLADYHAARTPAKLRLCKLMDLPDFPFAGMEGPGAERQAQG